MACKSVMKCAAARDGFSAHAAAATGDLEWARVLAVEFCMTRCRADSADRLLRFISARLAGDGSCDCCLRKKRRRDRHALAAGDCRLEQK